MLDFISMTDGYKIDHRRQYPVGTQFVNSNFTPRSSRIAGVTKVPFILLDHALQDYLVEHANATFFSKPKKKVCDDYQDLIDSYFGPNDIGTKHIADLHDLGYIPLEFKAFPEGTLVPLKMPFFTVENTHPHFFWVTNYVETLLSSLIWQGCTNAAMSRQYYELFKKYALLTGGDLEFVKYQGHDFSSRGMPGPEPAARSGVGHLVSGFVGTDTLPAIDLIKKTYCPRLGESIGQSIPATEHSVMCAGYKEEEYATIERVLDLYPRGPVAQVMDTWDLWNVIHTYLPKLKDKIMARDGKLVVRPDSGDPVKILCGDPKSADRRVNMGVVEGLWTIFGGSKTSKSYRLLDPHIGAIYGDSITLDRAGEICSKLMQRGLASTNWVAGIGSYTYQYNTRDTYGMAMKSTWAMVNGVERFLFKDPITDDGTKRSARGRIVVVGEEGNYHMIDGLTVGSQYKYREADNLQLVWRNGQFIRRNQWSEMRKRAQV